MEREACEAPQAVERFLRTHRPVLRELGVRLRASPPPLALTSARGSSDHAAHYFKYLAEILTGTPCCSLGASVVSVYGSRLRVQGGLCLTVSQSGQSPDIVAVQAAARESGAYSVALVNDEASPAARSADLCLPLLAGQERSVAATKSFLVSAAGAAAIIAHWTGDGPLLSALERLPQALARAADLLIPRLEDGLAGAASLYVVGRGPGLAMAAELALKLKETCALHAEAYSLAEVMHGPLELVGEGFPVLALLPDDVALGNSMTSLARMEAAGAQLLRLGLNGIPVPTAGHAFLDLLPMVLVGYLAIARTAVRLGRDPDQPRLLKKVTETL
jgi:glucosamine--fructose-6-phosphate aminotransferase (isomerizing)